MNAHGSTFADRLGELLKQAAPGYLVAQRGPRDDFDLTRGEVRFVWPESLLAAFPKPRGLLLSYQDPMGDLDLRTTYLRAVPMLLEQEHPIGSENVVVTAGAKQALWLALLAAVKSGDRVLLPRPGWAPYEIWVRSMGGDVSCYDPGDISAENLLREIASEAYATVIINSPNNPTGVEYSQDTLDRIATASISTRTILISDEVYRAFSVYGGTLLPHIARPESRVVVADSLSKWTGAAGLRVGFLVGGVDTMRAAVTVRGTVDSCPAGINQSIGKFLLSPQTRSFRQGVRDLVETTVIKLVEFLESRAVEVESSGALYVWIPRVAADGRLRLADGRVLRGTPGALFGRPGYARLCPVSDDPHWLTLLENVLVRD